MNVQQPPAPGYRPPQRSSGGLTRLPLWLIIGGFLTVLAVVSLREFANRPPTGKIGHAVTADNWARMTVTGVERTGTDTTITLRVENVGGRSHGFDYRWQKAIAGGAEYDNAHADTAFWPGPKTLQPGESRTGTITWTIPADRIAKEVQLNGDQFGDGATVHLR